MSVVFCIVGAERAAVADTVMPPEKPEAFQPTTLAYAAKKRARLLPGDFTNILREKTFHYSRNIETNFGYLPLKMMPEAATFTFVLGGEYLSVVSLTSTNDPTLLDDARYASCQGLKFISDLDIYKDEPCYLEPMERGLVLAQKKIDTDQSEVMQIKRDRAFSAVDTYRPTNITSKICLSPDNRNIAFIDKILAGGVWLMDPPTGAFFQLGNGNAVADFSWAADSKSLFAILRNDRCITKWDIATRKRKNLECQVDASALEVSPLGDKIAVGYKAGRGKKNRVSIVNGEFTQKLKTFVMPEYVEKLRWSRDGACVAVGMRNTVIILDVQKDDPLAEFASPGFCDIAWGPIQYSKHGNLAMSYQTYEGPGFQDHIVMYPAVLIERLAEAEDSILRLCRDIDDQLAHAPKARLTDAQLAVLHAEPRLASTFKDIVEPISGEGVERLEKYAVRREEMRKKREAEKEKLLDFKGFVPGDTSPKYFR